jgi:hypothetical protein
MKTIYKSNTRYEKVYEQMQLLGIQEVTTEQQSKNGTREFKLPIKDQHSKPIYVASFTSGYVRRTKANGYSPSWQLNKNKKTKSKHGWDMIERILIPNEADRLEYLIAFCLKNYYIGQANMLSSGRFIPKWKYDDLADPEVSVIVNNQKYKVT